jgi:hypothetical protein
MSHAAVADRLASQQAEDAFKQEQAAPKEPLMDEQGRPTPRGWRKIGELLRTEMPVKDREGRGGKRFKYITARQVMDRLDLVVGPGNWANSFPRARPRKRRLSNAR